MELDRNSGPARSGLGRLLLADGRIVLFNRRYLEMYNLSAEVVKPDVTVQMRPIKTGATVEGKTVIDSGLQEGETVVTDGQMLLVPGAKVRIKHGLEAE